MEIVSVSLMGNAVIVTIGVVAILIANALQGIEDRISQIKDR